MVETRRRYSSGMAEGEARRVEAAGIVMSDGERRGSTLCRLGLVLLAGLMNGACSMGVPLTSLSVPETTQSVASRTVSPLSPDLGEEDWRRAKGALAVALDPQGSGAKVSWDNPDTTLRGTFTPVGQPFVKSDEICRAFLATVTGQSSEAVLQGTACRPSGGEWAVKEVRPFKRA
jgi:surface antigen